MFDAHAGFVSLLLGGICLAQGTDPAPAPGTGQGAVWSALTNQAASFEARTTALQEGFRITPRRPEFLGALTHIAAAREEVPDLRRRALEIVRQAPETAALFIPIATRILADRSEDLGLRRDLIIDLSLRGDAESLQVLGAVTADRENDLALRRAAALALVSLNQAGPLVAFAQGMLGNPQEDGVLRDLAWTALPRIGLSDPGVREIVRNVSADAKQPIELRSDAIRLWASAYRSDSGARALLLKTALDRREPDAVRQAALHGFEQVDGQDHDAQRALFQMVQDKSESLPVRRLGAEVLERRFIPSADHVPVLLQMLESQNEDRILRLFSATALAETELDPNATAPVLARVLADPDESIELREASARLLKAMGQGASPALEVLLKRLGDPQESARVKVLAASSAAAIAQGLLVQPEALSDAALNRLLGQLEEIAAALPSGGGSSGMAERKQVEQVLEIIAAEKRSRWWTRFREWFFVQLQHAWFVLAVAFLGLGVILEIVWLAVYWVSPGCLWRVQRTGPSVSSHLLLLTPWLLSKRGLRAWIRTAPRRGPTRVGGGWNRTPFVSLPVIVDGQSQREADWPALVNRFRGARMILRVQGAPGSGKTRFLEALANRIEQADGEMLILSVNSTLQPWADNGTESLRKQTEEILGTPIDARLFRALRKRGWVAVFADNFDRWDASSQTTLLTLMRTGELKKVVLASTGLVAGHISGRSGTVEIAALDDAAVLRFAHAYLGAPAQADRAEIDVLAVSRQLSEWTGGRAIPAGLVEIFLRHMASPAALQKPAHDLGDLVERWLQDEMQEKFASDRGRAALEAARAAAWAVLETRGLGPIAVAGMKWMGAPAGLEEGLLLVQEQSRLIQFSPDRSAFDWQQSVVAEYLLARSAVAAAQGDRSEWRRILRPLALLSGVLREEIIYALADCVASSADSAEAFWIQLSEEGTDAGASPQLRERLHLRGLVRQLEKTDNGRSNAIEEFISLGREARSAVPALLRVLREPAQEAEARMAAFHALNAVAPVEVLRGTWADLIRDRDEPLYLRMKALEAVGKAAPQEATLCQALVEVFADRGEQRFFRMRAGECLEAAAEIHEAWVPELERAVREAGERELRDLGKRLLRKHGRPGK